MTETRTSPPSGLNLTALWSRLTKTCPSRCSSPWTGGDGGRHIDHEGDPLAIGEQPQPLDRFGRDLSEVEQVEDAERAAALDPRQVEQLVDHLDEVARLDLDLADPIAHPGRDAVAGGLGFAVQRLGEKADRGQRGPQLVRQVVDELRPDLLEPAQLGDVLHHDPQPAARCAPGTQHELRSVGPGDGDLAGRGPDLEGRVGDGLDLGVDEGLDERPAEERPGRLVEQRVSGRVGADDPGPVIDR